ncbi:hypothetical protein BRC89_07140 [Halobacteriales archaeon QS_4_70_19]|nr:MAG: hypothetical protein BRC89_07140 [Halobacteriales archaeon QS_4_70_19]
MPNALAGPFLLDVMLGKLATYLRMCGHDATYALDERAPYAPDDRSVWRCNRCGQQFWRGSHWDRVAETLAAVRGEDE